MKLPIRIRLALAYCAAFFVLIAVLEVGTYFSVRSAVHSIVDRELNTRLAGIEVHRDATSPSNRGLSFTIRSSPIPHFRFQVDTAVMKKTRIHERMNFEVGAQVFNVFNHHGLLRGPNAGADGPGKARSDYGSGGRLRLQSRSLWRALCL